MTQEEMLIRLGLDPTSMTAGTAKALDFQKKSALEYVAFWESAISKREAAEKAQYVKSIERERAKSAAILRINAERLELEKAQNAAAVAAIAAGSGGYGWKAGEKKTEGGLVKEAEGAAIGVGVAGAMHRGTSTSIFREMQVLLHEGIAGRWKQFISSFSRLLMFMGLTAETLVTAIPIIGPAILAIVSNLWMKGQLKDMAGGYGTIEGTAGTEKNIGDRLRAEIEQLVKAGKITEEQGSLFNSKLGSLSGIKSVQRDLAGIPGAFTDLKHQAEVEKEVARIHEQARREDLAADREKMTHLERIKSLSAEHSDLLEKMNKLDMSSVEYAQNKLDQARLLKQMDAERAEIQREQQELQRHYDTESRERLRVMHEINMVERETPTGEMLAGRSFMARLNNAYGKGGPFDLESGTGPFAGIAQQYELAKRQQLWDIIHGNATFDAKGNLTRGGWRQNLMTGQWERVGDAAWQDRQRQIGLANQLGAAGLETPEMKFEAMKINLNEINRNIGELLAKAAGDGIKIQGTD